MRWLSAPFCPRAWRRVTKHLSGDLFRTEATGFAILGGASRRSSYPVPFVAAVEGLCSRFWGLSAHVKRSAESSASQAPYAVLPRLPGATVFDMHDVRSFCCWCATCLLQHLPGARLYRYPSGAGVMLLLLQVWSNLAG